MGGDNNQVQEVYDKFDSDGNRYLDREEFGELMHASGNHTEADIDATFAYYDHNGDGQVSYEEFQNHVHGATKHHNKTHHTTHHAPTHHTTHHAPMRTSHATHHAPMRTSHTTHHAPMRTSHTTYGAPSHHHQTSHATYSGHHQGHITRSSNHGGHHTQYNLRELFDKYDRDRDGFLNSHELTSFYNGCGVHMSEHDTRVQLKYINPSHGDKVNFHEFEGFVRAKHH